MDYIPRKEKNFYEWQGPSVDYARTNADRFGISAGTFTPLLAKRTDYESKYAVSENPETRTSAHILARKEARVAYAGALRSFFKAHILYNEAVTDEDRRIMGLNVPDVHPTPVPRPTKEPEATVSTPSPATLEIHFRDKDETGHAKAYGIHGAEVMWGVLETAPVDWSELPRSSFATHSPLRLTFSGYDRGKTVYFAVRWENNRGEKGPWSEILSAIVP
ncbi:MAG: hypothetical protein LBF90_03160 [Prevotellaceae bacterium]|jgi:hypothetical protein|nr:hypothetical protein [Prevotellaceae bacterium]